MEGFARSVPPRSPPRATNVLNSILNRADMVQAAFSSVDQSELINRDDPSELINRDDPSQLIDVEQIDRSDSPTIYIPTSSATYAPSNNSHISIGSNIDLNTQQNLLVHGHFLQQQGVAPVDNWALAASLATNSDTTPAFRIIGGDNAWGTTQINLHNFVGSTSNFAIPGTDKVARPDPIFSQISQGPVVLPQASVIPQTNPIDQIAITTTATALISCGSPLTTFASTQFLDVECQKGLISDYRNPASTANLLLILEQAQFLGMICTQLNNDQSDTFTPDFLDLAKDSEDYALATFRSFIQKASIAQLAKMANQKQKKWKKHQITDELWAESVIVYYESIMHKLKNSKAKCYTDLNLKMKTEIIQQRKYARTTIVELFSHLTDTQLQNKIKNDSLAETAFNFYADRFFELNNVESALKYQNSGFAIGHPHDCDLQENIEKENSAFENDDTSDFAIDQFNSYLNKSRDPNAFENAKNFENVRITAFREYLNKKRNGRFEELRNIVRGLPFERQPMTKTAKNQPLERPACFDINNLQLFAEANIIYYEAMHTPLARTNVPFFTIQLSVDSLIKRCYKRRAEIESFMKLRGKWMNPLARGGLSKGKHRDAIEFLLPRFQHFQKLTEETSRIERQQILAEQQKKRAETLEKNKIANAAIKITENHQLTTPDQTSGKDQTYLETARSVRLSNRNLPTEVAAKQSQKTLIGVVDYEQSDVEKSDNEDSDTDYEEQRAEEEKKKRLLKSKTTKASQKLKNDRKKIDSQNSSYLKNLEASKKRREKKSYIPSKSKEKQLAAPEGSGKNSRAKSAQKEPMTVTIKKNVKKRGKKRALSSDSSSDSTKRKDSTKRMDSTKSNPNSEDSPSSHCYEDVSDDQISSDDSKFSPGKNERGIRQGRLGSKNGKSAWKRLPMMTIGGSYGYVPVKYKSTDMNSKFERIEITDELVETDDESDSNLNMNL